MNLQSGFKRQIILLFCLLVLTNIALANGPPLPAITDVSIADDNIGPVTISATITNYYSNAYVYVTCMLTNGLVRYSGHSDALPGGWAPQPGFRSPDYSRSIISTRWSSTNWWPYFVGLYNVLITEYDPVAGATVITQHLVSTNRILSGAIESIKYQTTNAAGIIYNPTGVWDNVNTGQVTLATIGPMAHSGVAMYGVPCMLNNITPNPSTNATEIEQEAYMNDISPFFPTGTHFRFTARLHERPIMLMGLGNVQRYLWAPENTNDPGGPGIMTVDITSCSPWASSYDTILTNSVGIVPEFTTNADLVAQMRGMIMCTTAHYTDIAPVMTGSAYSTATNRVGCYINGHIGYTNYLMAFISDTLLTSWGLTNVADTNNVASQLRGFIDGQQAAHTVLERFEGGTNIVYDWDGNGLGESGYKFSFAFVFTNQQPQISIFKSTTLSTGIVAEVGLVASEGTTSIALAGDFDGDRLADPAVFNTNGNWKIKLSGSGYALLPLTGFLGGSGSTALAADFDGDDLADPAVYNAESELWAVKLSSLGYPAPTVLTSFGGNGWEALAGDFDGDRLADPALYQASTGDWKVKLSTAGYVTITKPALLGLTGSDWTAIAADFDGDGKVDPAIYKASTGSWIVMMSRANYGVAVLEAGFLGSTGYTGMAADFDDDRYADPAVAQTSTGNWKIKLSGGNYSLLELNGFLGE